MKVAYKSKTLRSKAPGFSKPFKNAPLFRASEIVCFATCPKEDTHLEIYTPSPNLHAVEQVKEVGVVSFLTLAKEIQNLQNADFIHIDPYKTELLRLKSAILFPLIPPSLNPQPTIENNKRVHIKDGERTLTGWSQLDAPERLLVYGRTPL